MRAWIDRSIAPRSATRRQSASVRSSTQERFRRDVLGVQPGPDALPAVPPGMVVVTPPAPDELTDLLAGYRATLQVADDLPPMLTVRAGNGRMTRRVRVPRLRMFLRYFLNQHICRRLAHLKRAFHADAALGRDRSGELAAIDHFEQAIVPVPVRRIVIWFAVSVIFSAVFLANVLGISLAIANFDRLGERFQMDSFATTFTLSAIAWVCLVGPLARLAHLAGIWRKRVADSEAAAPAHVFTRAELGTPDRRHGVVSDRRAAARELLVKAPFWTGSVSLLFLPAIVNGVWTIVDPERRGLQDRAAGTRVVRAARRMP
jgi:hypothetical protein